MWVQVTRMEQAKYEDSVMEEARLKMLNSMMKNLDSETASNQSIAQKDAYLHINSSVKLHIENGTLHISGMTCSKKVIVEGTYKEKKSSPVVLAQEKIKKELNLSTAKWRNYKFENLNIVKTGGNEFVLGTTNGQINSQDSE